VWYCLLAGLLTLAAARLLTQAVGSDEVVIASWNVRNLGDASDVQSRAAVIGEFDIVALQEVESEEALSDLVEALSDRSGYEWRSVVSPRMGEGGFAEFYAFVYRAERVQFLKGSQAIYPAPEPGDFVREPFFATFRAGVFDFTLVTVHVVWGDSTSPRATECRRLVSVWDRIQGLDPSEDDLILLGDFNRDSPTNIAFDLLKTIGVVPLLTASGTRTTFGTTAGGGYWYDNIWIDPRFTAAEWTGKVGAGSRLANTYGTGCSEQLRGISDHCPVWAVFATEVDDDPSCP